MRSAFVNLCLFVYIMSPSQVGINTSNPEATLDIRQSNLVLDDIFSIKDSQGNQIFTIKNDGKVQTKGVNNSPLLFDLRGGEEGDVLAVGNTSLSYKDAGEGVIKYEIDSNKYYLSTDSAWKEINLKPLRVLVSARPQEGLSIENDLTKKNINWKILSDDYQSMDLTSGYFKAPHSGNYAFNLNITFRKSMVNANTYFETNFLTSDGKKIKCLDTYAVSSTNYPTIQCSGSFLLDKDETFYVEIFQNTGYSQTIIQEYSFFSIVEL